MSSPLAMGVSSGGSNRAHHEPREPPSVKDWRLTELISTRKPTGYPADKPDGSMVALCSDEGLRLVTAQNPRAKATAKTNPNPTASC
jgi:hypothetical protein